MRKTTPFLFLLALASLTGCPSNNTQRDTGPTPPVDMGTTPPVDMGTGPGTDSGMDAASTPATDVPIASVVNGAATDHPADGTTVHVTGNLVALTERLFVSQSMSSMRCLYTIWVGTAAGGDYSGIQVTETFLPSGTNDCFTEPAHMIPDTVMIGDSITTLTGRFINFCPSGSTCPPNTAQELDVTNGTFTAGGAGSTPTATDVSISDITGMGLSFGPRSMALQGALVHLTGTVLRDPPRAGSAPTGNNNVMSVSASGSTTPTMPVQVSKYGGVGCQRMVLSAMAADAPIGDITGVLQYSFGQWTIQLRQREDLPSIMCPDAGTGVDAGM